MFNFFKRFKKKSYSFVKNEDKVFFIIKEKKYENVVVHFFNVHFLEDNNVPKLKFNYEIVDSCLFDKTILEQDSDFIFLIGNILENYIIEKVENFESFRDSNT